jgi:hypothetical protein
MAALLMPLDDLFAALTPMAPAWVQTLVFIGMTVSVAVGVEHRMALAVATPVEPPSPVTPLAPAAAVVAPAPMDLHAALRTVLDDARQDAERLGVQLELAIPAGLPLSIDPGAFLPVLRALLRNAIEHAPGGHVFVGAMRAESCVRIIVIDDGKSDARPIAAALRGPLARLLARSGAGLVIDHRPGDGTTLVLTVPEAG